MNAEVIDTLNRLLAIEHRSLPMYLADADPWVAREHEPLLRALQNTVADQRAYSQRIAELILDRGGLLEPGEYPMEFTDLHFLSLDYLMGRLLESQRQAVAEIEQCVRRLQADPQALALAQEVLGSQRAHLEMFEACLRTTAAPK
jgi:hypothetical protein